MERNYFLIESGHELEQKIKIFINDMTKVRDSRNLFKEKHGGKDVWVKGRYLAGLSFDGPSPQGWISPRDLPDSCYRPKASRIVCKEAWQEFKDIPPQKQAGDFDNEIGFSATVSNSSSGFMIHHASFEKINGTIVINLPENGNPPKGLVEIKKSEYWQMKEQEENAA